MNYSWKWSFEDVTLYYNILFPGHTRVHLLHNFKIGSNCANFKIGSHKFAVTLELIKLLDNRKSIIYVLQISWDNRKTFFQQVQVHDLRPIFKSIVHTNGEQIFVR